ncbi:heterokaryon incompatibility protein-domain-containing protein [Immersiella caudata]|uniref:Heterokaryon incompatibility protein-domain-containing protein n=1 Tax=Immersiella caudata TaxID=314043 RepID=A0AA39WNV2_9PEZI|nr:heterokaryon incompatibility protein-domain-containing protein [Immersiella caudata]
MMNSKKDRGLTHQALRKVGLGNAPSDEFSNFYTPSNDTFYANSPYLPLDARHPSIRLLRVHPQKRTLDEHLAANQRWAERYALIAQGSSTRPPEYVKSAVDDSAHLSKLRIACDLIEDCQLSRAEGRYLALSYYAGSPKNVVPILVDGVPFNTFANLEHAIGCAMEYWYSGSGDWESGGNELFLWADQVCINQNDTGERSSQVARMGEIYHRSQECLVCLSTSDTVWDATALKKLPTSPAPLEKYLWDNIISKASLSIEAWVDDLEHLLTAPWWRRAWILQEFVMASRARFLVGTSSLEADVVNKLVRLFVDNNQMEKTLTHFRQILSKKELEEKQLEDGRREREEILRQDRESLARAEGTELRRQRSLNNMEMIRSSEEHAYVSGKIYSAQCRQSNLKRGFSFNKSYDLYEVAGEIKNLTDSRSRVADNHTHLVLTAQKISQAIALCDGVLRTVAEERHKQVPQPTLLAENENQKVHRRIGALEEKMKALEKPAVVTSVLDQKLQHSFMSNRNSSNDLPTYLEHSRHCQSGDNRDRVYAFIGLVDPSYGIVPDYSADNTIVNVLIETATKTIEHDCNLGILSYAAGTNGPLSFKLPSWVPDWTRRRSTTAESFMQELRAAKASREMPPRPPKPHTGRIRRTRADYLKYSERDDVKGIRVKLPTTQSHETRTVPEFIKENERDNERDNVKGYQVTLPTRQSHKTRTVPEFVRDSERDDVMVLKAKGIRHSLVPWALELERNPRPAPGELTKYQVAGESLVVKAMAPTSSADNLELWFLVGADHPVVLRRSRHARETDGASFVSEALLLDGSVINVSSPGPQTLCSNEAYQRYLCQLEAGEREGWLEEVLIQ